VINILNHNDANTAELIFELWQKSYPFEAKLIGVVEFPPLNRKVQEFQDSNTTFIGIAVKNTLVTILEYDLKYKELDIHSLVVHPDFMRKGYGMKMMEYVLSLGDWEVAKIETGAANTPAINLYEKMGFIIQETYSAAMGISKVKMEKYR